MSLTLLYVALAALILILIASTLALRSWNRFAARARRERSVRQGHGHASRQDAGSLAFRHEIRQA